MKTIILVAALAAISTAASASEQPLLFDAARHAHHDRLGVGGPAEMVEITRDNHVTIKDLKNNRVTHTGKCDGGGCTLRDPRTGKTTIIMRDFIEPYRDVRR